MSRNSISYCAELTESGDLDRYWSALFAPADQRRHLFALYAFNLEVAKIRDVVSEPMLGEIRLQWWRETIDGIYEGQTRQHEVALALAGAIEAHNLPQNGFQSYLDERQADLEPHPFASVSHLERFAHTTNSFLLGVAAKILMPVVDQLALEQAAKPGGTAHTISSILRALPVQAQRQRCDIPDDLVAKHKVDLEALYAGRMHVGLRSALDELIEVARENLVQARNEISPLGSTVLPAFLPLSLVEVRLRRLAQTGFDPFRDAAELQPLSRQLRLLWHMVIGRI